MTTGHVHRIVSLMEYQLKDSQRRMASCLDISKSARFDPNRNSKTTVCIADIVKNENLMRQHMLSQEEYFTRCQKYIDMHCSSEGAMTSLDAHQELKVMVDEFTKSSRKMVTLENNIKDAERKRLRYAG